MPHGGVSSYVQIPTGGAPGRVQTPNPWDKIIVVIHDESANWLADQNGVSKSKGSLDFQGYETI